MIGAQEEIFQTNTWLDTFRNEQWLIENKIIVVETI